MSAFLSGESAVDSAFARTLLPAPATIALAATTDAALTATPPGAFLASQSAHVDSSMCRDPTLAISGQVRGSVSSAKTHSSARTASQGAVDGGASGSGTTSDADGFHPLGTPTVTLKSHVVDDLPPPHSASVTRYTPAFYANMTGPTDTNATVPLTYSTVRVNTTIGATGHGVSLFHCSSAF